MLYGIETESTRKFVAPPGGAYTPDPVRFIGWTGTQGECAIKLNSLISPDNGFCSWAGWFRNPKWIPTDTSLGSLRPWIFQVDSTGFNVPGFHRNFDTFTHNPTSDWDAEYGDSTGTGNFVNGVITSSTHLTDGAWIHIMSTADVNHPATQKILKTYVGDIDRSDSFDPPTDPQTAWSFTMNGKDFWLGSDGAVGDSCFVDIADFSFWPGLSFLTAGDISVATRRLFIDAGGAPVDPTTAITSLGTPAIMCEAGLTGFLANSRGNSGTFAVPPSIWDSPINTTWA